MIDYIEDDLSGFNVEIESTLFSTDYDDEQFNIDEKSEAQTDILFE